MGRLLILLLIVAIAAVWVYQRVARRRARDDQPRSASSRKAGQSGPAVQDMVACAHCGVHLPRGEAVAEGALHFCGDTHRRLGPRA